MTSFLLLKPGNTSISNMLLMTLQISACSNEEFFEAAMFKGSEYVANDSLDGATSFDLDTIIKMLRGAK